MSRRHLTFDCLGSTLAGTLDEASGKSGLLIVTGGNETRAGAFSSQAHLAAKIAAEGYSVMRFDRRGVGVGERLEAGGERATVAAVEVAQPAEGGEQVQRGGERRGVGVDAWSIGWGGRPERPRRREPKSTARWSCRRYNLGYSSCLGSRVGGALRPDQLESRHVVA